MNCTKAKLLKIISFVACGIFVVSVGKALLFEFHPQYGRVYTMPLRYGYLLVNLRLLILQFSFATLALKTRFCVLNDNLRFTFQNISTVRNSGINIHSIGWSENLPSVITDLYNCLYDCINLVNDSFTFQLIPFMVYYLTENLFAIHTMIQEVFFSNSTNVHCIWSQHLVDRSTQCNYINGSLFRLHDDKIHPKDANRCKRNH